MDTRQQQKRRPAARGQLSLTTEYSGDVRVRQWGFPRPDFIPAAPLQRRIQMGEESYQIPRGADNRDRGATLVDGRMSIPSDPQARLRRRPPRSRRPPTGRQRPRGTRREKTSGIRSRIQGTTPRSCSSFFSSRLWASPAGRMRSPPARKPTVSVGPSRATARPWPRAAHEAQPPERLAQREAGSGARGEFQVPLRRGPRRQRRHQVERRPVAANLAARPGEERAPVLPGIEQLGRGLRAGGPRSARSRVPGGTGSG